MRNCYDFVPYLRLAILLWTLLIVVLCNYNPSFGCPMEEYEALLKLRSSILQNGGTSPYTWGRGRDCCLWERVTCNNSTQQVSKLNLSSLLLLAHGQLNFSIFSSFHELRLLNLSKNSGGLQSQMDVSGLKKLEILDLSFNGLSGTILLPFKNLSSLHELYLEGNQLTSSLDVEGISGLRKLEILDLTYNMLIGIPLSFKNLSSLSILNLRANRLNDRLNVEGLLGLQKLRVLNLGFNHQATGEIPIALGNLSSLNFLYLDSNGLIGSVPSQVLSGLKNLHELDLSYNHLTGSLPLSLENLVSLKLLDLSYNKMKGNIPSHIFAGLVSLQSLDLSYNLFDGHFSFSFFHNLSKLDFIDMSNNEELFIHLDSEKFVPSFHLRFLILSHCNLEANILATPAFLASQYRLKLLDISGNNLIGNVPNWLFENLTRLEILNLRNNSIKGEIQFPNHLNTSLYKVDLSMNFLSGSIPTNIGTIFPRMVALNLSSNILTGNIPSSLGNMSNLQYLDLSDNNFSGEVPTRLMIDCTKLFLLRLSNNNLHGKIFGTNYGHASLYYVHLDGNKFTGTLPNNLSSLAILDVHNNQLTGMIPESIELVSYLRSLKVAGNHFHGPIPHHLCNLTNLEMLDLSHNSLSGSLPHCIQSSDLVHLKIAGNALTGTIPSSYFNISSLVALDVSDNQLSGKVPRQIGDKMPLGILVLGGNSLEGPIPIELCKLQSLHILDLSQNNLSGSIPACLGKMHFRKSDSVYIDLSRNGWIFAPAIDPWPYVIDRESLLYLYKTMVSDLLIDGKLYPEAIMMVDLMTKGILYAYPTDHLLLMSAIDLSANKLTGNIPPELGNLDELVQLNLSHNQLIGPIPETFSTLHQIESLDISHNQLSGVIPWQLTELKFLEVFSVAYNNLSGCTLGFKDQFATFDKSSYEGNVGLHGPPLEKTCSSNSSPTVEVEENQDDSIVDDAIFFSILAASFAAGFWGCIAFLLCHHSGRYIRRILDGYVDSLTERILIVIHKRTCIQWNRK